jgi:hypothetical protein
MLVCALACIGLPPDALADGGGSFTLKVDRHAVRSGEAFTASATAPTTCQWLLEWNGDRRVGAGRALAASYTAPQVTRPTRITLHGTCFYSSSGAQRHGSSARSATSGASQRVTVTVPPSWRHSEVITVLPPGGAVSPPASSGGGHHGDGLPGTGGPALAVLIAALCALLAGSAAVRASTHRLPA